MNMSRVTIDFTIHLPEDVSNVIVKSILPELSSMATRRSKIAVNIVEEGLSIKLTSNDLVAARAASNTLVRLLAVSYRSMEMLRNVR